MMKARVILPLLLCAIGFSAAATDNQQMVDFMVSQMKAEGDFVEMAKVSGIAASKLEQGYRRAMSTCLDDVNLTQAEDDAQLNQCLFNEYAANLYVSQEQFEAWVDALEEGDDAESMTPVEALYAEMDRVNEAIFVLEDKEQLSSDEQVKLAALEQKLMELAGRQEQLHSQDAKAIAADMEAIIKHK